jgi:hypothetical protein
MRCRTWQMAFSFVMGCMTTHIKRAYSFKDKAVLQIMQVKLCYDDNG